MLDAALRAAFRPLPTAEQGMTPLIGPRKQWLQAATAGATVVMSLAPVDVLYGLTALGSLPSAALRSAILSVVVANLAMAWAVRRGAMFAGPRPAPAVLVAALMASIAADPQLAAGGAPLALAALVLTVAFAGALQWLLGACRLGRVVKFVPLPVISGITNGSALAIVLLSVKQVLGVHDLAELAGWADHDWGAVAARALVVVALLLLMGWSLRRGWKLHWSLVGLLAGSTVFLAVGSLPSAQTAAWLARVGGALPAAAAIEATPVGLLALPALLAGSDLGAVLRLALPLGFVVAAVNSIDTLVSVAHHEALTGHRADPDRVMRAIGVANLCGGLLGSLPLAPSPSRTLIGHQAGAGDASAPLFGVATALLLLLLVPLAIDHVPRMAATAVMLFLAWTMLDAWSRNAFVRVRQNATEAALRRSLRADLLLMAAVALLAVTAGLMVAVVAGLLAAMAIFVRHNSRSIVAASYRGDQRRSLVVRTRVEEDALCSLRGRIVVVELAGPLFFGSADAMREAIEAMLQPQDLLVLSFRNVSPVDSSGVAATLCMLRGLQKQKSWLAVCDLHPMHEAARAQLEPALLAALGPAAIHADIDRALQSAEDWLLCGSTASLAPEEAQSRLRTGAQTQEPAIEVLAGFDAVERARLLSYLQPQSHAAGSPVFHSGDVGDALYLVLDGEVEIRLTSVEPAARGAAVRRFALFRAGAMFGELGFVQRQQRSSDAIATRASTLLALRDEALNRLRREHPDLAFRLMEHVACHIARRLTVSNAEWRFALRI